VSARSRVLKAVVCAASIATLAACSSSSGGSSGAAAKAQTSAAPTASAVTPATETIPQLKAAIARGAASGPYSAAIQTQTLLNNTQVVVQMSGQVNLNTTLTGYLDLKTLTDAGETVSYSEVLTDKFAYIREADTATPTPTPSASPDPDATDDGGDTWRRSARTGTSGGPSLSNFPKYAELLLSRGASAVKGDQTRDGVKAVWLSGRITAAEVKTIEPSLYSSLTSQGLADFGCDIWVDPSDGRVIRLEQTMDQAGQSSHSIVALAKFGAPLTVAAPSQ
jgi:hypothetical protein